MQNVSNFEKKKQKAESKMTSEILLNQVYTGEELFHCNDRTLYAKGSTVYVLNEDGSTVPFYTNDAGKIDAIAIAEGAQYLFLAHTKLATSAIDVINLETKTLIHTYQLPSDITYVSRMAISADYQVLAFITALPREVLYVMRLNHMSAALISAQLDLSSNRTLLSFSANETMRPGSLSFSRPSSWIGLSFCPEGHALICISHKLAVLVTFHFTAQFCYLVARQVGVNLRSPKRALNASDFISRNYIHTIDPHNIRGTDMVEDTLQDQQTDSLLTGQCIVSQQYGGSGLPMGKGGPQRLSSPDGDWLVHSEDEVGLLLQNVYSQAVDAGDRLHNPLELLPLVSTYCSLESNASTNPADFGAISISTRLSSHFYSIDKVLDDESDELEDYFLFPNGLRTTDPTATLTNLVKAHNFNLLDIRKVFHFTGSHVWIPKQSVCLIVCRNMGVLAVVVPDFNYIYSSDTRKAITTGSFIFPPPPKTAFLITDYGTNDPNFDVNTWAATSDSLLGLGDGISARYFSKHRTVPSLPLNGWYLGDRRLMSIASSVYLKVNNHVIDSRSTDHDNSATMLEPVSGAAKHPDEEAQTEEAHDYTSHVLIICGFGDSTVKWFSLPLATEPTSSKASSTVAPLCTYTYASLGPVRYMTMMHLTDRSAYYQKGQSFYNIMCLCLFSEAFAYLPMHSLLDDSGAQPDRPFTGQQPVVDQDPHDEGDTGNHLTPQEPTMISPSKPAILCTIVPSLAYRGENLRATHFRSLVNIKIMANLEVNRNSLSNNAYQLIIYALSKYNSGILVDYRNRRCAEDDHVSQKSIKPKALRPNLKEFSCSSNLFISLSDYVPLVTVCKPISPSPFVCNTVRNSIAFLSFPISALAPQRAEPLKGQNSFNALQTNSSKTSGSIHCAFIGTLDCGRLYMLFVDDQHRVYAHYFSCRIPMSIMDSAWTVPDPICSMISLQESKLIVTGHVSGYIRVFSAGFSNVDSLPLGHRMIINLIFRVKASDLPIMHLASSPSLSYITALDSADNLFLLGGPQYEFTLCGFLQLKNQPHLTPQFMSQPEQTAGGDKLSQENIVFGYSRASFNFQSYIVEKFTNFIIDGASISSLLRRITELYDTATQKCLLEQSDYGANMLFVDTNVLKEVDVLNPVLPSPALTPSVEGQDITKDTHKVSQYFMTLYEMSQVYTVPVRKHSMSSDVLSQNSHSGDVDNEDDAALRQVLHTFCNNLRPTYNPFIDDFIPLLFNNTTDMVLTNDCIYISFSTGDILRLSYPQINVSSLRAELNAIVLQNDYDDALNSNSERDLENAYTRYTKVVTDNLLLPYSTMKPYIIRTGYAVKCIAVDPMCIPPPCSLSDIVYVGLEDGRLFCYISKHEIDQTMMSRISQYIQDTPLAGLPGSSGSSGICQMRGPITTLSVLHDSGLLAVTDMTGLTLVMQLCQVTTAFLKRVINQARDLNDMSGPNAAQSSTVILPTQNDMHVPTPHTYGMPISMTPTTYYYIDSESDQALGTFSSLYSNSLLQGNNTSAVDTYGSTISYFSEQSDHYCVLLIGTSLGSVHLYSVNKALVTSAKQYVATLDSMVSQFLQVQTTQESMTISGTGSKVYLGWKLAVEQRQRARSAVLTATDYQAVTKLYENLLVSVSDSERIIDGCLWKHQTSLAPPLYTHHPMVITLECDEILSGIRDYNASNSPTKELSEQQDRSCLDSALKAVQMAIKQMHSRIDLVIAPSYQDVSLRFAAQICALRFNSRSKQKKLARLIGETQKLRESCRELEADNARILADNDLDTIYTASDLRSLEGLLNAKQDLNLVPSETPTLMAIQSRVMSKNLAGSILSRIDSIKSFKASMRELEAATTSLEADQEPSEPLNIDVNKLLRATARVSENAFRISDEVTLLVRSYLLKHMTKVEQYMKSTVLRSMSYLHVLEDQLIHRASPDEIGYAVCGLADPCVHVASFPIPKMSGTIMIKARKVCLLRSAQIVSERYSIYAPQVTLQRAAQGGDNDDHSHRFKDNPNRIVFGTSTLPQPHRSIFTRIMTNKELPYDETGTLLDFSAALQYSPAVYHYKSKDPFFLEDNKVQVVSTEDQDQAKDSQDTAQTYTDLPGSQTLYSMLQLSTLIFDRAPQIPFAQVAAGESLGFVYPKLPTADVIGSHGSLSLRRALFTETECAFAIRAKQQILLLQAIGLLLMKDFNAKLAAERDKKYKLQSRIHDIATQIKENSKELVYLAKESTLMGLIEQERKRVFTDLQNQGIGVEDAASRAAKQAVLGLPSEDTIAQLAIENVDIKLLDINTITGYSPGGGDTGIEICESLAIMLGYNPYLQHNQSGNKKSYVDILTDSLRTLANQCTIEKTLQVIVDFLAYINGTGLSEISKTGASAVDIQQAQLASANLLGFSLKFTNLTNNPAVNAAILTLTDEGLFKVDHLKTLIRTIRDHEKTRNNVTNKEVLRLWYSYKRALYDMMRGAIDAANRVTVRDIPIPTVFGLDKIPGMKLTKEQEQELDTYNTKIKELVDKRLKEKRQLEASCSSLREQAEKLSVQFDNDRLHILRAIRFNAELKLQAIQLAIGSLNLRLLDRAKTLGTTGDLTRYERCLSAETVALNNAELIVSSILNRLQQRLVTLRSAEKFYNLGIKRELQDPHFLKYLKQRSNPKITRNALRQYFTTKPDLDSAVRDLLNTTPAKQQSVTGTLASSTFSASGMSAAVSGAAPGSTASQGGNISFDMIQNINNNVMNITDPQAAAASQQKQTLLIESEEEAIKWLAQTHSLVAHYEDGDFRDLTFEVALAESLYFDSNDTPVEIANLMSLPATENPVMVSLIHKIIPLHGLPNITQLLAQVPSNSQELKIFDVIRCTKLALELQIYETTKLLQEVQSHVGKVKAEGSFFTGKLERHHSDTLALSRQLNAEFINLPLLVLVTEGQVESSRVWDFAVDKKPLVFGGIRVGIDIEKTQTRFINKSINKLDEDYASLELDAGWDPEKTGSGEQDDENEGILLQDNSSFVILGSNYIDELNDRIKSLGERRSTVLMNLARFRQQTKIVQYRINLIEWQRKDAIAQTKDYQLIRVSKEMHDVLRESSSTTEKRSREVNTVQRKLEHTRKANILANNQLENKINAVPLEIQAIEQQNIAIEARINELRAKNIQRRQAIPEAELNEAEIDSKAEADKKFRRIAALRKMKELSKAQEEELQFLMRELEKLRRRTYPSFD